MKAGVKYLAWLLAAAFVFAGCSSETQSAKPEASTEAEPAGSGSPAADSGLQQAISQYREYAIGETDSLIVETEKFVKAVKDGDIDTAKKLYAPTRMYYERIEPIAEALGDLDPNIDARENDVEEAEWRGFHRIEKGLWAENKTAGYEDYADRLLNDVKSLRALMETVDVDASLLVTGAVELLNEVSSSKVTGEEERYSHTDLYDFAANVEGAKKIYELLRPELESRDADLSREIAGKFDALEERLNRYKSGDGYVSYLELKDEDTRALSQALDALAEPLSMMGKALGV